MRVHFIGCPCSGKTTTAAMTFATLKELGIGCEFIAEQARTYIAQRRYDERIGPEVPLHLDDEDQLSIMKKQLHVENIFSLGCTPDTIIITDSSPLNSLLYMSTDARQTALTDKLIEQAIEGADLVFYAPPVDEQFGLDANRIHNRDESLKIDESIPKILKNLAPAVWDNIILLNGDPKTRLGQVTSAIMLRRL